MDHPAVLPKVRALYGDRFVLQAAWCTVMPAATEHSCWHQDGSSAYDFKQLGYPVPLLQLRASFNLTDQSELGQGNMALIPGSHRSPVPLPQSVRKQATPAPSSTSSAPSAAGCCCSTTACGTRPCPAS